MLENKKRRQFLFFEFITFILCILLSFIVSKFLVANYQRAVYEQDGTFIHELIQQHPELEVDIIKAYQKAGNAEIDTSVLEKYGYTTPNDLEYLKNMDVINDNIVFYQVMFSILVFVLLNSAYFWYQKYQSRKLKELDKYLLNVLSGNYNLDIREYEDGILNILKNDVYKMSVLLKEDRDHANDEKKYLESVLSDISHQLRTPLTSMYVMNDLLSDAKVKGEKRKEILKKNRSQLERIEWLITTLLKMSRIDSGTVIFKKEEVEAGKLIKKALEPINIPVELKKQTILIVGDKKEKIALDLKWTTEAFVNILKNAHEHTGEGGMIIVKITNNPLFLEFLIQDNGCGIKKEDLPHIFERFYKGKNSSSESIGIGLNMSKTIIEKEDGVISVESIEGKGTTFQIKFFKTNV